LTPAAHRLHLVFTGSSRAQPNLIDVEVGNVKES
jgi:hypothetical protein